MEIVKGFNISERWKQHKAVLALGNFDGIHRGHKVLIDTAVQQAKTDGAYSAALILDPHPSQVLYPERAPRLIISQTYQGRLLDAYGLDALYYYPFSVDLAQYSPRAFVEEILLRNLKISQLIVGFNYSFGYKGAGNPEILSQFGEEYGFTVQVIEPICHDGELISSSLIRQLLDRGEVVRAREYLGYYPVLEGMVIEGERRGKTIGIPTANLGVEPSYNIPAQGVYSAFASVAGEAGYYRAAVNIGIKPTFHESYPISIEAHLFDFNGDVYGRSMSIYLVERLRDEQKFQNIEELLAQIRRDQERARQSLAVVAEPKICATLA